MGQNMHQLIARLGKFPFSGEGRGNRVKSSECAAIFKAMADENRVDIVRYVARHPGVTASILLERLDIAQSTLSHHMKVLTEAQVIVVKRKGKWARYSVNIDTVDRLDRFINGLRSDRSLKARRARAVARALADGEGEGSSPEDSARVIRVDLQKETQAVEWPELIADE